MKNRLKAMKRKLQSLTVLAILFLPIIYSELPDPQNLNAEKVKMDQSDESFYTNPVVIYDSADEPTGMETLEQIIQFSADYLFLL